MQADSQLTEIGAMPLSAGDPVRIGPFRLRAVLGSGGMGRVYLGVAPAGYVAVKRIHPELAADHDFIARFGHELDNQARLPRTVSVPVLATDRTARPPWFATEYIPGVTVQEAANLAGGRLPVPQCRTLLCELAAKLSALDGLGMVHRDIKPSNIMLGAGGVTLIDFGLAVTDLETRVTTTGAAVGTPLYMSPEQFRGDREITPAADIWALGGVLAFAATGRPPFGDGLALSYRVISEEPDLAELRDLDPGLAGIVARCLAKDPAQRPSAAELAELAGLKDPADPAEDLADDTEPATPDWTAGWPVPVTGLIARRQSFAAKPDTATPDTAATADVTGITAGASAAGTGAVTLPEAGGSTEADRETRRKNRRRRLALVVIPVLIIAGTGIAAMRLAPFWDGQHGPGGSADVSRGRAAATVSGGATPTPTPPRKSPKPAPTKASTRHVTGGGASDGTGGGTGQDKSTGTGGSGISGGTSGGGGGTGSGTSGGGGGSATSGGTTVVSTSPAGLENVAAGECLGSPDDGMFASLGSCGSSISWKKTGQSGNLFEISDGSGDCLGVLGSGEVGYGSCAGSAADNPDFAWQLGTSGSGGGTLVQDGSCLGTGSGAIGGGTAPVFTDCNAADSSQLWRVAG